MMARPNITSSMVSSDSLEKGTEPPMADSKANACYAPSYQLIRSTSDGPVAILWDIENCPVPSYVRPEDVAGNIRMALRVHPVIQGAVMMFSAYGDFNAFPRRLREGCQRTGVKLVDVPNGRKDAADKAILVDMFLFALDNPPPSTIMLISGDVDFAPALHILGQRGYTVILVIPSGVGVSSALSNAGKFLWDWPSVARGEGFAPAMKAVMSSRGTGAADVSGYFAGVNMNDNLDGQMDEEAIVYRGISQRYYNSRDFSIVTQSVSEYNSSSIMPYLPATSRSYSLPSGLNEASSCPISSIDQNELTWVQPGDLNGLKRQLARLLELSGGCLPLVRVPAEYLKVFGRPLYVAEYGAFKLINLFKKMEDLLCIEGKGAKKFVYLRNSKACPSAPPLILAKKENKKGKEVVEENADLGSSDEYSDGERVVLIEHNGGNILVKTEMGTNYDANLEQFKHELQEILVSYSCRIFLGYFEAIYLQRYKKQLDYAQFGIDKLEELFERVSDVVTLQEEPESKKKFVVALDG